MQKKGGKTMNEKQKDIQTERATFTVPEAAKFIGINVIGCYDLCRTPGFPAVRIGQKRLVIPREALRRWLDAQAGNNTP